MSDAQFPRLFPEQQGYRFLLVDAPAGAAAGVARGDRARRRRSRRRCRVDGRAAGGVPRRREHVSLDVPDARRPRAAGRHGRAGRGAAAQRARAAARAGAAARRRLPARRTCSRSSLAENALLLGWGLVVGARRARWSRSRPAALERGARLPLTAGGWLLLLAVFAAGLVSSIIATRAALRAPLRRGAASGVRRIGPRMSRDHGSRRSLEFCRELRDLCDLRAERSVIDWSRICVVARSSRCSSRRSRSLAAENWPQWRGPSLQRRSAPRRTCRSSGRRPRTSRGSCRCRRWSGSTPIVWGDRIFLNVADALRPGRRQPASVVRRSRARARSCGSGRSAAATTCSGSRTCRRPRRSPTARTCG